MNLPPQTLLQSRYEIRRPVEQDAVGARYLGLDLRLGRDVSVRTFPLPPPQAHGDHKAMDDRISQVASLRHPGVELFLDMGFHQRLAFVISEWVPQGHLGLRLQQGTLDWPSAAFVIRSLLRTLRDLHAEGVAHGRLSPSAVLLGPGGQFRLRNLSLGPTDLLPEAAPTRAPEGPDPTPAADLYACGQLLRAMVGPGAPPEAEALVAGLTAPEPEDRLAFARGLDLDEPTPVTSSPARWGPWIGLALVALLGAGAFGIWSLRTPAQALTATPPQNLEAAAAYRRARYSLAKRTGVDLRKAEAGFLEALRLEPGHPSALAGLAQTYALQPIHGVRPIQEGKTLAREAAQGALVRAPEQAEARAVLAYLAFRFDWDWELADRLFQEAVRSDPQDALVRHWYGFYLSTAGRHDEGIAQLQEAARLDPVDLQNLTNLGVAEVWSGRLEAGLATLRKVTELDPTFNSSWDRLMRSLESAGRIPEALEAARAMVPLGTQTPQGLARLELAYRQGGSTGYLQKRLESQGQEPSIPRAAYAALLGRKEAALADLDASVKRHDLLIVWAPCDPAFRSLHGHPGFARFLASIRHPLTPHPR